MKMGSEVEVREKMKEERGNVTNTAGGTASSKQQIRYVAIHKTIKVLTYVSVTSSSTMFTKSSKPCKVPTTS